MNTEKTNYWKHATLVLILVLTLVSVDYITGSDGTFGGARNASDVQGLATAVIPEDGVTLPIHWGNLGARMVETGVIDKDAFEELYAGRGGMSEEMKAMISNDYQEQIVMNQGNSGELLNLLWAFGLSNKNPILESPEDMQNPDYGGAGNFASTGGWTIARGDAMKHYGAHSFVSLSTEQQDLVERVSQNIYRPCCGNSTHFPDCNHGMAMLGLLELLAYEGLSESEMYDVALAVNSYWFPETYMTLATYFENKGTKWDEVDSKLALSADYSSGPGYQRLLQEVQPIPSSGGGGCSA